MYTRTHFLWSLSRDHRRATRSAPGSGAIALARQPVDAWGNLVESTGTDGNPYRYAGERFDQDTSLIYLRARWYEAAVGRFASADDAAGQARVPISQNKYLYADVDPSDRIDRSGYLSSNEQAAAGTIVAIMAVLVIKTYAETSPLLQPALSMARERVRIDALAKNKNKDSPLPVIYYGRDVIEVTNHIDAAQSQESLPPVLSKGEGPEPDRSWYRNMAPCKGKTFKGSGKECDEYPFASTDQGGRFSGRGFFLNLRVSVAPVDEFQNAAAGLSLKAFYKRCGINTSNPNNRGWFGVVALPWQEDTDFICGRQ